MQVGTNHIQRESSNDISRAICKPLQERKSNFQDTPVYFSGVHLQIEPDFLINLIKTNGMYFISLNTFAFNRDLNESLF